MADGNVLDTLQINIEANSANATRAINDLKKALGSLNRYLGAVDKSGNNSASKLANSLNQINGALGSLTTGNIKRVQKLANAMRELASAASALKGLGKLTVPNVTERTSKAKSSASSDDGSAVASAKVAKEMASGGKAVDDTRKKVKALNAELRKTNSETKKAGENAKKASGSFGKLMKAIGRITMYRAIRAVLKAITDAFSQGLKNAYEFERATNGPIFNAMNKIKSATSQLVNQLGAAWGQFMAAIAPYLVEFLNKVTSVLQGIAKIIAKMRGETQYLVADSLAVDWNEATDAVKKYKGQLLGLDELNNLSSGKDESSGQNVSDMFHYEDVGELTASEQSIVDWFEEAKVKIEDAYLALKEFFDNLDILDKIRKAFKKFKDWIIKYMPKIADAIMTINGVLTLGPGYLLIKKGIKKITDKLRKIFPEWDNLDFKGKWEKLTEVFTFENVWKGIKATWQKIKKWWKKHVGAIFTKEYWDDKFMPIKDAFNFGETWEKFKSSLSNGWNNIKTWWSKHLGKYFTKEFWAQKWQFVKEAFTPSKIWGNFTSGIKVLWENLKRWWNEHISKYFTKEFWSQKWKYVKESFDPAKIWGNFKSGLVSLWEDIKRWWDNNVAKYFKKSYWDDKFKGLKDAVGDLWGIVTGKTSNGTGGGGRSRVETKAVGGTVTQGSLFYAGEAGPEFVGSIGGTSAVANTSQMTEAIESAAYKGMARALSQYGGGMSGYEPATTDDLFVVLRKKAKNYTRMTGKMAF